MNHATTAAPIRLDIPALARKILESSPDTQSAIDELFRMATADPNLRDKLTERALATACDQAIRSIVTAERNKAWRNPSPARPTTVARAAGNVTPIPLKAWSQEIGASLMEGFRLTSGRKLGDGSSDDLREAINIRRATARDHSQKARFLELILEGLQPGQRVRDVFQESDLATLHTMAHEEA